MPTRFWIALSSSCIWRRSLRSRAPSGSSRSSTAGSTTSARQGDALALAAGKLVRPAIRHVLEPDQRERLVRGAAALGAADASHHQPEADIARDAHMGKQRVVLNTVVVGRRAGGKVVQSAPAIRSAPSVGTRKPPRMDRAWSCPSRRARAARCSSRARSRARCSPAPGVRRSCGTRPDLDQALLTSAAS